MKLFLFAGLFAASVASAHQRVSHLSLATFGAQDDGEIIHFVEPAPTPNSVYDYDVCSVNHYVDRDGDSGSEAAIILDQIINMGKKIWAIVEAGKPVLEAKYSYANALPKGVKSSADLDGFSPIRASSYRMYGKNLYGVTVYDFTYTLVHRHSGNYSGKGHYLDNVTVLPQYISLWWGYNLSARVGAVSTVNLGTKDAPVAGLGMELEVKVSTKIKATEFRGLYDFHGDSDHVAAIQ